MVKNNRKISKLLT